MIEGRGKSSKAPGMSSAQFYETLNAILSTPQDEFKLLGRYKKEYDMCVRLNDFSRTKTERRHMVARAARIIRDAQIFVESREGEPFATDPKVLKLLADMPPLENW